MNEGFLLDALKILIPVASATAVLLLKIGRTQQEQVQTKEAVSRLETQLGAEISDLKSSMKELLSKDVFVAKQAAVEGHLGAIEKRVERLERKAFNGVVGSAT